MLLIRNQSAEELLTANIFSQSKLVKFDATDSKKSKFHKDFEGKIVIDDERPILGHTNSRSLLNAENK